MMMVVPSLDPHESESGNLATLRPRTRLPVTVPATVIGLATVTIAADAIASVGHPCIQTNVENTQYDA